MGDMRMYQDERRLDFHALGREIKRKREAKGWTQEYLAQLVDRTPRSIMYFENRGQHPSLNTFYQIVTLLDISVDQFFYPDRQNSESDCRQHIDPPHAPQEIFCCTCWPCTSQRQVGI